MFWIRGREVWGASPATVRTRDDWARGVTLVIHHTAGAAPRAHRGAEENEMRSLQRQHQRSNGWSDIGYNYVIMPSGRVYEGRGFETIGAHTKNHNTGTIGVSFAGNYDTKRPTLRSITAYLLLVRALRRKGARINRITGHRFMPNQATACPGRYLVKRLRLR